jgi:hypothetical protein
MKSPDLYRPGLFYGKIALGWFCYSNKLSFTPVNPNPGN